MKNGQTETNCLGEKNKPSKNESEIRGRPFGGEVRGNKVKPAEKDCRRTTDNLLQEQRVGLHMEEPPIFPGKELRGPGIKLNQETQGDSNHRKNPTKIRKGSPAED